MCEIKYYTPGCITRVLLCQPYPRAPVPAFFLSSMNEDELWNCLEPVCHIDSILEYVLYALEIIE